METPEKYSLEKACEEADKLQAKIKSGKAHSYSEAESIIEVEESRAHAREYGFGDGLEKSIAEITKLLESQVIVVVGFNGSDANIGKSFFAQALAKKLHEQGVDVSISRGFNDLEHRKIFRHYKKIVFIFEQLEWGSVNVRYYKKMKESYDREVKNELGKKRYKVKGVDFWIGIYRPDKPFGTHMISGDEDVPIADIIIRNDSARDK